NVIDGCKVVFHVASPFVIFGAKDPENTLIKPAVEGTRTVLEAATRSGSVERVVLTSSIYALYGDNIDILEAPNGKFDENSWNTTSSIEHQPYPYSKKLAEETAWKTSEGQPWDLVVLNPGFVLGPSLTDRRDSASIDFMLQMTDGRMKGGVPDVNVGVVDVRDVARAHIVAAERGKSKRRYILVAKAVSFLEIAQSLQERFGYYPLPQKIAPKWVFKLLGPFIGFTRKYVNRNFGFKVDYDANPSREELGIGYRPVEDTVNEMLAEMEQMGMVKAGKKK
ncbi:MAG: NAD-dependent epimerase/dehydratase family protein, partial [Bacteroidota bacterium]